MSKLPKFSELVEARRVGPPSPPSKSKMATSKMMRERADAKKTFSGGFADKAKADAFADHVAKSGGKVVKRESNPSSWDKNVHMHTVHYTHPKGPQGPYLEVKEDVSELDESKKEYKPEEGHKVKIIGKGMQHSGKSGYVHQVSPAGTHAGVQDKNGKHIGYYHSSDLKQINEESLDEGFKEVTSHTEYKKLVKKHYPDAKQVDHHPVSDITQHVVGPQQKVVGHWDHKYSSGRVKIHEDVESLDESKKTDHKREALEYDQKARRCKPGTEEHFQAMSRHHYHAGMHAQSKGDAEAAREHFTKSYSYGHVDRADRLREEQEELAEISKATLGSYIVKAANSKAQHLASATRHNVFAHQDKKPHHSPNFEHVRKSDYHTGKTLKRHAGIAKAVKKLTTEETSGLPMFSQFIEEQAKERNHHNEANAIVTKHTKGGYTDKSGAGEFADGHDFHSHGVQSKHINALHNSLKAAGYHKHEGETHKPYSGSNYYPPESPQTHYHKYTKGKTRVMVANHENSDHGHVVEVVTPHSKKEG